MENKEDLLKIHKDRNPKKFLIYGAVIFLVFVIGVIVFALVQTKSSNENSEVIPPQVKEEPLFKEIPIQSSNNNSVNIANSKEIVTKENNKTLQESLISKQVPVVNEKENKNIKETKKTEIKPKATKHIKKEVKHYAFKEKYYVQVAALMKYTKPNKKFLALLKKYKYNYIIYPVIIKKNGKTIKINKLLIGPFKSKEEAKKELIKIKKYITQNAFIYKVKK